MRVIILNDFAYVNGGSAKIALDTALGLAKNNIDVTLFSAVGPVEGFLKNIPNLNVVCLNQYDILNDPNRLRAMINGIWNLRAKKAFKDLLKKYNNEDTIIHVHGIEKALSSSCINIAVKMGFRVLYHLHEYGIACPNMGFYNYKKQSICTLKPLSIKCIMTNCDSRCYAHKCWRIIRQYIQKNIGGIPKNVNYIYITKFSFNILKPFLNKNNKIFYLSNPIDTEKKERIQVERNKEYIFIGRLVLEKNPMLLADVSKKMGLSVTFIGAGYCENEIKKIYKEAKITGWCNKSEIEEILEKARCLVFPSSWYETQGLVVLEALSRGIPCIVSKNCAAIDSIIDGETGLSFKNNNFNELEKSIEKMSDNLLVKKMSKRAYERFWKNPDDINTYLKKLIEIYKNVINF